MNRHRDGRPPDALRPVVIRRRFTGSAPGSVLIEVGRTKVLCTATIQHQVPDFLRDQGRGWLTAEYAMLPGSTPERRPRERTRPDGRSAEIQRLIGRALRSAVDLEIIGERTIWIDCDVLEADGGTRTAAITGAWVALADALRFLREEGVPFPRDPLRAAVAAVSVGLVGGTAHLDLTYEEDARAEVDMNVVMNSEGRFIEVQGTAEAAPFGREQLEALLDLAAAGIRRLLAIQQEALAR